jgi:membrane protease YdiL (CAAX protease family)
MDALLRIPRLTRVASPSVVVCAGYTAGLVVAELAFVQGGLLAGAICHAVLLVILLAHHLVAPGAQYHSLLVAFALLPLMRLIGLAVPVAELPYLIWHVMVGIPMLLAAFLVIRAEQIEATLTGISSRFDPAVQLLVAAAGIPLGLVAWTALRPAPVIVEPGPIPIVLSVIVSVVFIAGIEELVFRGILQGVALRALGSSAGAVAVSAIAYASLFVSSLSPAFVVVMLLAAIFFGWVVEVTGSLWGVIGAHALIAIGLLVAWPTLLAAV